MQEKSTNSTLKELGFIALFSLTFGSMMGSGVFDIPQNVAHSAGEIAVLICWIITAIGMLALSWAFIYLGKKRPDIKSGIYGYAKHGFGDYVGFNAAWGYWLNALLGNASYLIYIFATLSNFTIFKYFGSGTTLSALICESILIWGVYALIIRGIQGASIVNILITTVKLVALAVVVVIFIFGFHWSTFRANFNLAPHFGSMLTQVKSTMLVTTWDFLGIEAACIYALRAKNMRDVARATMLSVITVLSIDALISVLPFGIISSDQITQLITPSTAGLLNIISGLISAEFIRCAVIISVVGALLAWSMLATNIFFLAADDKVLPSFMKKMNKHQVPSNALLVSMLTLQAFVLAAYFTNSVYLIMIQLATSLILVPYLLSALFALKLVIKEGKIDIISFIKGILATLYGVWLIYAGGLKYLAFSCCLYILGVILYSMARKEYKKAIFDNKFEAFLFIGLIIVTIISLYEWHAGTISVF